MCILRCLAAAQTGAAARQGGLCPSTSLLCSASRCRLADRSLALFCRLATCTHRRRPSTWPGLQSNDALRSEIERLRGEPSPLLAARTAKEETLADKEKFLKLLDNLQVGSERRCLRFLMRARLWHLCCARVSMH